MRTFAIAASFSLLAATLPAGMDASAQTVRTIRVTGSATVRESPNQVTIRGTLSAGGEDIEKAAEQFKKVKEAFEKALDADEVSVEFAGEKLMRGGGAAVAEAFAVQDDFDIPVEAPVEVRQYSLSEEVVLRIAIGSDMERAGIAKKLGKVFDAASKAGLTIGATPNPMVAAMGMVNATGMTQFELDEEAQRALRTKAYRAALADGRSRAAALAELSGGRLGKVISIEESAAPQEGNDLESLQMAMLTRMFGGALGGSDGGIDPNGLVELRQDLVVTFELID